MGTTGPSGYVAFQELLLEECKVMKKENKKKESTQTSEPVHQLKCTLGTKRKKTHTQSLSPPAVTFSQAGYGAGSPSKRALSGHHGHSGQGRGGKATMSVQQVASRDSTWLPSGSKEVVRKGVVGPLCTL